MKNLMIMLAMGIFVVGCASKNEMSQSTEKNMSHAHMGHVFKSWKDTPNKKGLLPTARIEAEIVVKHAGLAEKKLSDLGWMKMHTKHVMHAVDPSKIEKGPGLGYGVIKATSGVAKHINLAANSSDASDNVKKHAVHISMTANNTGERAAEILVRADKILQATSAKAAAAHVIVMNRLAQQLLHGEDFNGDGKITWHEGEGGIVVAEKHMGALKKAEGIYAVE